MRPHVLLLALCAPLFALAQPATETALAGTSITFAASADGVPPPSFQWRKDGVDLPGKTGVTLLLEALTAADAGVYSAIASNEAGSLASNEIRLVVDDQTPPVIADQSGDGRPKEGTAFALYVIASGNPSPAYQWRKNGVNISGANAAKLSFDAIKRTDAGLYDVVVTNAKGSVTSRLMAVEVLYLSPPVIKVALRDQTVRRGDTATFQVVADGASPLRYEWIDNKGRLRPESGPVLAVNVPNPSFAGWWSVEISNPDGSARSEAYLTVTQR